MAVITTEGRNELTALYVAMMGVAPGSTALSELVAAAESGKTLLQIATDLSAKAGFGANFPGFMTGQEFANALVADMLPTTTPAAAITWATNWVLSALNSGKSRAQVITEAVQALRATANTNYTDAKAELANEVDVSLYYAITKGAAADSATALNGVNASAASVTAAKTAIDTSNVPGANSSLTTSTDALVGDSGNNTFNGTATSLTAGDKIDGGTGTDRLVLTATGTTPTFTLTSVETVDLTASPNPAIVNLTGSTGITSINNLSSANGASLTVSNVGNVVNTTLTGSQAATTITYTTAAVAGTADASTLTLAGTSAGATFTANGVETVTVASTTSANTLTSLNDTGLTKLVVTGDKDLTITSAVGGTTIATVDASAATGKVTLTTGAGAGGTNTTGVTVTGPTATGSIDVTTGANKDTVTLGAGNNTVVTAAGNDTITSGAGTNTITPGTGNDTINLSGGKDTIRFADAGAANADTVAGVTANTVLAFSLGSAQVTGTTPAAATAGVQGVLQTGSTSPTAPGVGGTGTGTAVVVQAVNPNATATVGTVAATSTVVGLNGAFTDGTVAGVITALGTTATTGINTTTNGKFLLVTYSVGNIAQVWSYAGDTTANTDIDAAELTLVATLSGVAQNSLTAANFAYYLAANASTTAPISVGQTINLTTPLNTVTSSANANGHFLTAAQDTVNVAVGMLPTAAATATSGLTVIDSTAGDADVLNATVLAAGWDAGTIISGIETINLTMLATDTAGFSAASTVPGATSLNFLGTQNVGVANDATQGITNVLSGTKIGLGAEYTGTVNVANGATLAALTLDLNGSAASSVSSATSPTFTTGGQLVTALTVNANANQLVNLNLNTNRVTTATFNGSGNVTVFDTAADLDAANVVAASPAYTGNLTFRPSTAAAMDFSAGGVVTGLKGVDLTDQTAWTNASVITLPAVAAGGVFTVTHGATATVGTAGGVTGLVVNQLGSATNDAITVSLGSASTGFATAGIVATGTETLTIASAAASTVTVTMAGVQLADAAGTQSVTVTGAGNFVLGSVTADSLTTSGVTGTVSATLVNTTGGVTFTGGNGATTITNATANADSITTGNGNDTITAGAGADVIVAGAGTDNITGGDNADVMTGGSGADTFVFANTATGTPSATNFDTITDYTSGSDIIDFGAITLLQSPNADAAVAGHASVTAGVVTFHADDDTLAERIIAVADAIAENVNGTTGDAAAGDALIFQFAGDSYLFVSDATAAVGATDVLIKLVGLTGTSVDSLTIVGGDITALA